MAKPTHLPGSSVEEIIASIRGGMGVEESKVDEETPETSETAEEKRSAGNVSKLFGDEPVVEPLETEGFGPDVLTDVTPSEIGQSETEEPVEAKEIPPDGGGAVSVLASIRPEEWLLSPTTDATAAGAVNQLASTLPTNSSRTVEQMTEEMLRPMLKNWLDENLPPLVERLVREEIERVSRRR